MVLKLLVILGQDLLKRTKIEPPLIFGKTMSTKKNNYNCSNQRLGEAGEIDEALLLQHRALLK